MQESVIDFPKAGLCPEIWEKVVDDTGLGDMWKMRQEVKDKLVAIVQELQTALLLPVNDLVIHVTGSITSNLYTENADIDLHFHSDSLQLNSNEEVDKLNNELRASYKQEFIGKHPIEIYYQDNKFQDYMSVGCYDVTNDIWEVGPEIADSSFNPYAEYYDEAKKQSEAMASLIRNKILSVYETAIALKKNLGTEFGQNLRGVLLEQLASVQALYDSIRKTRKVYSSPTSKEEALQFRTSRKWHIADTAFKLFDKYGYLAILKSFIQIFDIMSSSELTDIEACDNIIKEVRDYIGNADKLMDSEFYEAEVNKSNEKSSDTPQYDRVYNEINKLISLTDDLKFGARDKLNRGNKCILLWHGDVKKDKYGFDDYSGCDKAWDPNKSCGLVEVLTFPNHKDLTETQADEAIEKARSFISKHSIKQVDEASHDKVKIWVDDVRPTPPGYMTILSVDEFIEWFDKNGSDKIEVLDLDYDAGKFYSRGGDYIHILDYLEIQGVDDLRVRIHSDNPVGRQNMQRIIKKNGWKEVFDIISESAKLEPFKKKREQTDFGYVIHFDNLTGRFALYVYDDDPEDIYLANVDIWLQYQGQGLGTLMLKFAITQAKTLNGKLLRLRCLTNSMAQKFYEKNGFKFLKNDVDRKYIWMFIDLTANLIQDKDYRAQLYEGVKELMSVATLAGMLAVPGILPAKTAQKAISNNLKYEMIVKDLNLKVRMIGNYTAFLAANIIARTLYAEARNDGKEGMEAVASVIYNRADGKKELFTNACLKPKQFSCWNKFTTEEADPKNFKIKIPRSVNKNKKNAALWKEAKAIAADMLADAFKPTTTANMYYNDKKAHPDWGNQLTSVKYIGSHKFGILKNHSPFV